MNLWCFKSRNSTQITHDLCVSGASRLGLPKSDSLKPLAPWKSTLGFPSAVGFPSSAPTASAGVAGVRTLVTLAADPAPSSRSKVGKPAITGLQILR